MGKGFWDAVASFLSGEASDMMKGASKAMIKTMEETEQKIEHATIKAIKASSVFLLIFVGLIFVLVGLSSYLTMAWELEKGVGLLIVGGALVLLGWFAKLVR